MEQTLALWSGYCRPHAQAFFQRAVPTDLECQASRVVRWLRAHGAVSVSRTEVRRLALGRTVDTRGAERVMARLVEAGALRAIANDNPARPSCAALARQPDAGRQASLGEGAVKKVKKGRKSKKPDKMGIG